MKASKRLKELPGFDDAMVIALNHNDHRVAEGYNAYPLELVGEISIPALKRVSSWVTLQSIALHILIEQQDEKRRLRVVPTPAPVAANDCEAAQ